MQITFIIAFILLALFILVYLTGRRFGVLGLALCAGSLLSASWTDALTPLVQKHGVTLLSPPLTSVIAGALILLPPLLLLFSGPRYAGSLLRLGGAICFALLALTFLLGPLATALPSDHLGAGSYEVLQRFRNLIIVIGIGLALLDILLMRSAPHKRKS